MSEYLVTYGPVVIQMTQLVRQTLNVIRFQTRGVVDYVVMTRGHSALSNTL